MGETHSGPQTVYFALNAHQTAAQLRDSASGASRFLQHVSYDEPLLEFTKTF